MQESPIFSKTSELLEWLLPATMKFPKSQRFVLAKRVQDAAFNFYEAITAAALVCHSRMLSAGIQSASRQALPIVNLDARYAKRASAASRRVRRKHSGMTMTVMVMRTKASE